jgi:hypothetical protein
MLERIQIRMGSALILVGWIRIQKWKNGPQEKKKCWMLSFSG